MKFQKKKKSKFSFFFFSFGDMTLSIGKISVLNSVKKAYI